MITIRNIAVEHIYLACGKTDMRKSINGLSAIIQHNFKLNPYRKDIFIFCGGKADRIKALLWDGNGFLLLYKRLDNGRFKWPRTQKEVMNISEQQLRWLLEGLSIEQPGAIKNTHRITTA